MSEGLWHGALGITELMEGHGAGLVDPHQQPVQPHHWSSVHPVLDVLHQTGGIGETGEAGADQRGAVRGHGGLGLAQEDSATEERASRVLLTLRAALQDGLCDLKLQLLFNLSCLFLLEEYHTGKDFSNGYVTLSSFVLPSK